MANISKVYLLDTPLEDDLQHTLFFTTLSSQKSYMDSRIQKSYTNVSYQRDTSTFRCPAHIDSIRTCNYMMYQNSAYSNKWFYCFIEKMTYVNDGMTDVEFKVDPIQTFMFDFETQPSFIEREHSTTDVAGDNTLPENFELGEYIKNSNVGTGTFGPSTMLYAVGLSEIVGTLSNNPSNTINGIPNGLYYVFTPYISTIHSIVDIYDDAGKANAIYTIFIFPKSCLWNGSQYSYKNSTWDYSGKTVHSSFEVYTPTSSDYVATIDSYTFAKPSRVGMSYTPRNKKMLTFPYCYFNISNGAGHSVTYHWEDFDGDPAFSLDGVIGVGCSTNLYPTNYKNMDIHSGGQQDNTYDYGVVGAKYPTISWNSDSYTNWITQNAVNVGVSAGATTLATVGNLALGNVVGASASAISGVSNVVSQFYQASLIPNQVKGNINMGDLNYSKHKNKFTIFRMSIKPEYARIVDDFWDRYGYPCHRVKKPAYAHRENWWYTKTIDIYIKGDIPNEYMNEIKQAYNNGITYWRYPSNFMNYSVSNGIV